MITQTYNLDLIPSGEPLVVHASQYDVGARRLAFNLYAGGVSYAVPEGAAATIRGTKPDQTGFMYAMRVNGSTVSIAIEEQMTAVYGDTLCEVTLVTSEGVTGSANFILRVEKAPLDDDAVISETEIPALEGLVQQAASAASEAQVYRTQALLYADNAEWARDEAVALIPATGQTGNYLQKTETGTQWAAAPAGHEIEGPDGMATQRSILRFAGEVEVMDDPDGGSTLVHVNGVTSMIVEVTQEGGVYTADHTYGEVNANYLAGGVPRVLYGQKFYPLQTINSTTAIFALPTQTGVEFFYLHSVGGITYSYQRNPFTFTVQIMASSWDANGETTITNSQILAASLVLVGYPAGTSEAMYDVIKAADIRATAQAVGSLTLKAYGEVPESAITLQISRWY